MANQEHLDILQQGVEAWNAWRAQHQDIAIDLSEADLSFANLNFANLGFANFSKADLFRANLRFANLSFANFSRTDLIGADLREANLREANLREADLSRARLSGADLGLAQIGWTTFGDVDLRNIKGLETIQHEGPSSIGIDTIYASRGTIPESFLRQGGVPDPFLMHMRALVESLSPIQFYTCFLSYSSQDQDFAKRLYADLQSEGVRCWYAPEDLKIGDKIRPRIDESIRKYDKLLIILSQHSVKSQWVEHEVETAIDKEYEGFPNVLFPIRLDGSILQSTTGWASHIKLTRHIGDFTRWKEHDAYRKAFDRLLRDLKAENKTNGEDGREQ